MKERINVGADVSAEKIDVSVKRADGAEERAAFTNDAAGHRKLIRHLTKRGHQARVCLEATGVYSLDLALALHRAKRIEVMVLNPRAVRRFAEALLERSKTDMADAAVLRIYAQRMDFQAWQPPSQACLNVRLLTRRIHALVTQRTQEKNRLHASGVSSVLELVRNDIEVNIRHLDRRIARLEEQALDLIAADEELARILALLTSIRGVAAASAARVIGELAVLPSDMNPRQWVAHAGLDPMEHTSGTSLHKRPRISRRGNAHFRGALYMPAHNAIQFEPVVRERYQDLIDRGKEPMQAKVAIMRKLLHAFHGMIQHDQHFDAEKFRLKGRELPKTA